MNTWESLCAVEISLKVTSRVINHRIKKRNWRRYHGNTWQPLFTAVWCAGGTGRGGGCLLACEMLSDAAHGSLSALVSLRPPVDASPVSIARRLHPRLHQPGCQSERKTPHNGDHLHEIIQRQLVSRQPSHGPVASKLFHDISLAQEGRLLIVCHSPKNLEPRGLWCQIPSLALFSSLKMPLSTQS